MIVLNEMLHKKPGKNEDYESFNDVEFHNEKMLHSQHVENNNLTLPERRSIKDYTDSASWVANRPHFNKEEPTTEINKNLDSAISKAPSLTEAVSVFSGINSSLYGNVGKKFRIGDIVHTPGYTSTSVSSHVANSFTKPDPKKSFYAIDMNKKEEFGKETRHVLHFKLPSGYKKGRYLGNLSSMGEETEYLLKPNQKWKITGRHSSSKTHGGDNTRIYTHYWDLEPHED